MIKLHTKDGNTVSVDLADERQAREWLPRLARDDFQATIRGVTLVSAHEPRECAECGARGRPQPFQLSIVRPQEFTPQHVHMEHVPAEGRVKGGERVTIFAGDTRLTVMAHAAQPAARIDLARIGKQKFNPYQRR